MFEIDKVHFGEFLSLQRKKKGYTQKDLAQRLFVSDKAVSKWERGVSMPDISLLIPLADILEVTVTELLEAREIENVTGMDVSNVENLVKKALTFSEDTPEKKKSMKRKNGMIFAAGLLLIGFELLLLLALDYTFTDFLENNVVLVEIMSIVFGGYFLLGVKEKLPTYYEDNRISVYSDGFFRINMAGIYFNNSNWPHIIHAGRNWAIISALTYPVIYLFLSWLFPDIWNLFLRYAFLAVYLGGLFIPLYVVGKKYE